MTSPVAGVTERRVATNGIQLNIAERGQGPLILLLHGFPESWYSWRHQFEPLSAAGYHVVAPDMRGYGKSDRPPAIESYNQIEVINDIVGLVPALGYKSAIVIGHDWGAPSAWGAALHHPTVVTAVGGLSVPYTPRPRHPPLDSMAEAFKDRFFYQLYFQQPGVAEAELERDIAVSLRKFLFAISGDGNLAEFAGKQAGDDLLSSLTDPGVMPAWLSPADLSYYVGEFGRSGFRGPLNYYRNHNLTWELTRHAPDKILQPAMYVAGDKDGVVLMAAEALKQLPVNVPDLKINELIPGIGHWTQQEAPDAVNDAILRFLAALP